MDAAAELGRNPVSKHQIQPEYGDEQGGIPKVSTRFSLSMEMSRLTRDGAAKPVSRDQIVRHARGQNYLEVY